MSFDNLRIGHRLALGFGAVLALLVAIVGFACLELDRIGGGLDAQNRFEERAAMARDWSAKSQLNVVRAFAIAKTNGQPEVSAYFEAEMKRTSAEITVLQRTLEPLIVDAASRDLLAEVAARRKAYLTLRAELMTLVQAADAPAAATLLDTKVAPASVTYLKAMGAVTERQIALARRDADALVVDMHRAERVLLGLLAAALAVGAGLGWLATRSIAAPLRRVIDAATRVAGGDLSTTVDSTHRGEIGDLLRAIGGMQRSLRRLVGKVRRASDSIHSASTEIATGNDDLSRRTEQTASNLQLAAASMGRLTGTVLQSAASAHEANQLAGSAAEVAGRGGTVVSEVVGTMNDITASSQRIADIVGTIDGIAFQTNILALNAAVEAARAGEQGRGFAIVAGEVRALAQRSAAAAREIRTLIGASVAKVEGGSRRAADAGRTMTEIVASVQRVSSIIGAITATTGAQSDGIREVGSSVTELDRMTQQNAALVEQSAAAARSLTAQATALTELIATFRLGDDARVATAHD